MNQSDDGFSLIETLVGIAVLGLAVAAIIGALGTASRASSFHRAQADLEAGVRSVAEAVKGEAYSACPATASYSGSAAARPDGTQISVSTIEYWNGSGFQSSCPSEDAGFQRVTIVATGDVGRVTRELQLIKRAP